MNVANYVTASGCANAKELNIIWTSIRQIARQAAVSMLSSPRPAFDADDVAQEVSIKLHGALTCTGGQWRFQGEPVRSLKGLIRRTAQRCMIDLIRSQIRDSKRSVVFATDCYVPTVPVTMDQKIDACRIFANLTPAERDTVIAAALDPNAPSGNTVNQRKARVRRVIRKPLEDIGL